MTSSRLSLVAAAGTAIVLVIQLLVTVLLGFLPQGVPVSFSPDYIPALVSGIVFSQLLPILAFAVGVWISLRYIAKVSVADGWRRVIRDATIAALLGAAAVLVYSLLQVVVVDFTVYKYPFVNDADPNVDGISLPLQAFGGIVAAVRGLAEWTPVAVLVILVVRLRLADDTASDDATVDAPATGRASRVESPSAR